MRVALDLLGGGLSPEQALEAVRTALDSQPDLHLLLVGPQAAISARADQLGLDPSRLSFADSATCVDDVANPVAAVRANRGASIRLTHRAVRDGVADACVTASLAPIAVAAAVFTLGTLPGVTQAAFATLVGPDRRVILLDAAASALAGADALTQFEIEGVAMAHAMLGIAVPRVGFLAKPSPTDLGRVDWEGLAWDVVGEVPAGTVALGGYADVVVTDGATAKLVLAAARGGAKAATSAIMGADHPIRGDVVASLAGRGGFVLGVSGVSVTASETSASALAEAIRQAAAAAKAGLVATISASMAALVARRRSAAGLGSGL